MRLLTHICELKISEQAMLWIQEISSCLSETAKTGLRKEYGLNESPNPLLHIVYNL